ncbi:ABC transporter permease [Cohnella sp. AR92]|uniref:ABC transporter permease n=1 Tax=Cohnella sp. AR92 TaxID=648716 RepID=UPI000F8C67BF|nr:ABC transporter permease [Cohnella sp. AR92]RUS47083.1 ABC transporter permease [Cohnella sp. AR92]
MLKSKHFELIRTAAVLLISLLLTFIMISFVSGSPLQTIGIFLYEPISSVSHAGNVVEMAIPLMFTGLALSLLFKMNMFNLGAEGIFYFSALVASAAAIHFSLNGFLHPIVAILLGGIVGALISGIPGFLKAKWNANELVTSLMFNSILYGVGQYILNYKLRDASAFQTASFKFEPTAVLDRIIPGTRIHTGLIIVLVCIVAGHYFMYKTKWGYELRMTGANREFAEYSGIKTGRVILYVHLLAGLIAGIGGSVEVLGMYSRFQWNALPGYGMDGALVAMLAKNNPLAVIGSALFLAYIRVGADMMSRYSDVPSELISIIQAVILLLVSADQFLKFWKNRMLLKEAKMNA